MGMLKILSANHPRMERCPHCSQGIVVMPESGGDPATVGKRALLAIAGDLEGCPVGMWRFFEIVLDDKQPTHRAQAVAAALGMNHNTLNLPRLRA